MRTGGMHKYHTFRVYKYIRDGVNREHRFQIGLSLQMAETDKSVVLLLSS